MTPDIHTYPTSSTRLKKAGTWRGSGMAVRFLEAIAIGTCLKPPPSWIHNSWTLPLQQKYLDLLEKMPGKQHILPNIAFFMVISHGTIRKQIKSIWSEKIVASSTSQTPNFCHQKTRSAEPLSSSPLSTWESTAHLSMLLSSDQRRRFCDAKTGSWTPSFNKNDMRKKTIHACS